MLSLIKAVDRGLALSPGGSNIESLKTQVEDYFGKISTQVGKLKENCDKSKERKEALENWKNAALILGGAALFAANKSVLLFSLPVGALWLIYEVHHSYRGKILRQTVELLNKVEGQKTIIDSKLLVSELAHTKIRVQQSEEREAETKVVLQSLLEKTESNAQVLKFLVDNLATYASFIAIQNGCASISE